MEKAKYDKMRQVNAVNGCQMVVKLRGSYYRRVKGKTEISERIFQTRSHY